MRTFGKCLTSDDQDPSSNMGFNGFGDFHIEDGYRVVRDDADTDPTADAERLNRLSATVVSLLESNQGAIIGAVIGSPVFSFVLSSAKPEDQRETAQLVPEISIYPVVESALREQAVKLATVLRERNEIGRDCDDSTVVHAILIGLNVAIRKKLNDVHNGNIIRTKINSPKSPDFISPAKIKEAVRRIKGLKLSDEESMTQLIHDIELIENFDQMSEAEKADILHELDRAVHDARELFKKMVESLSEVIAEMMYAGKITEKKVTLPELNDRILSYSGFELLGTFFNGREERNARDFNDIQSLLILAYALFKYRRHPIVKAAIKEFGTFTKKLTDQPFLQRTEESASSKIYRYANHDYHEIGERQEEIGTIIINDGTENEKAIRVKIDGTNVKEDESILAKAYSNKYGTANEVESMTDILRGRFVLWDITLANFQDNMEDVRKVGIKAGETLGLKYTDKTRIDLQPGEFRLEEPDQKDLFQKFTLHGITESGIPIEVQFIPKDVYELRSAKSPLDHHKYKQGGQIKIALSLIPFSVSPISHRAGQIWMQDHIAARKDAISAMRRCMGKKSST